MTPQERRAFLIYYARVNLREARNRRKSQPAFADTLLGWAIKARIQAAAIDTRPAQADLFAGRP